SHTVGRAALLSMMAKWSPQGLIRTKAGWILSCLIDRPTCSIPRRSYIFSWGPAFLPPGTIMPKKGLGEVGNTTELKTTSGICLLAWNGPSILHGTGSGFTCQGTGSSCFGGAALAGGTTTVPARTAKIGNHFVISDLHSGRKGQGRAGLGKGL